MTAFVSFLLVVTTLAVSASAQTAAKQPDAGDAAAGEAFFTGKGNCSSCHMVRGRGGILGPDLSNLARGRTVEQIEAALADPSARPSAPFYRSVSVRLRSGANCARAREIRRPVRSRAAGTRWQVPLDLEERRRGPHARAVSHAEGGRVSWGAPQSPRVFDATQRRHGSHRNVHRARSPRRRHHLRGDRAPERRRVAHLSRASERQPSQPAESHQREQRGAAGPQVDLRDVQLVAARPRRSRRSSSTA